jgi:hypothetical protein
LTKKNGLGDFGKWQKKKNEKKDYSSNT